MDIYNLNGRRKIQNRNHQIALTKFRGATHTPVFIRRP